MPADDSNARARSKGRANVFNEQELIVMDLRVTAVRLKANLIVVAKE
jgi:hypothetical protein